MSLTSEQITVIIGFVSALTALALAVANFLNHNANAARIDSLHARVDSLATAPAAAPAVIVVPPIVLPAPPAASVAAPSVPFSPPITSAGASTALVDSHLPPT